MSPFSLIQIKVDCIDYLLCWPKTPASESSYLAQIPVQWTELLVLKKTEFLFNVTKCPKHLAPVVTVLHSLTWWCDLHVQVGLMFLLLSTCDIVGMLHRLVLSLTNPTSKCHYFCHFADQKMGSERQLNLSEVTYLQSDSNTTSQLQPHLHQPPQA